MNIVIRKFVFNKYSFVLYFLKNLVLCLYIQILKLEKYEYYVYNYSLFYEVKDFD